MLCLSGPGPGLLHGQQPVEFEVAKIAEKEQDRREEHERALAKAALVCERKSWKLMPEWISFR